MAKGIELGQLVNQFILRRTNTLLSDHLPPKLVCVVCCSLSQVQLDMYQRFLSSKTAKQAANGGKQTLVLASITALKKLCTRGSQTPSTAPRCLCEALAAPGRPEVEQPLTTFQTPGATTRRCSSRAARPLVESAVYPV